MPPLRFPLAAVIAVMALGCSGTGNQDRYGLDHRPVSAPYLGMPSSADGALPHLLSQTGAFADTASLTPAASLIPYDLVVPFWSDGAHKSRWIAVPEEPIGFMPTGEWQFPAGTVLVKHFDLPVDNADPGITRRLETRLLVIGQSGQVYGAVYKWNENGTDAELLEGALNEDIPIRTTDGEIRWQNWYYPSREDCLTCHTDEAGHVLGVKTRQMNRTLTYPASGVTDNQLRTFNHVGLFEPAIDESTIPMHDALARPGDPSRSLDDRARSYLDANCGHCHRPGGTAAYFDARYDTASEDRRIVDGRVVIDEGIDGARVIVPHDIWRSIAFMRVNTNEEIRMPPLARQVIDQEGVALLRDWIWSMPGQDVVPPPTISPAAGNYTGPLTVRLALDEAGAEIRYTLDGSAPGTSDPLYEAPLELTGPTVLRARAYKDGLKRSIVTQAVFIVTE